MSGRPARWLAVVAMGASVGLIGLASIPAQERTGPSRGDGPRERPEQPNPEVDAWVRELVRKAGDRNAAVRDSAGMAVMGIGRAALPLLRSLSEGDDREQAAVAVNLIRRIEDAERGPFAGGPGGGFGRGAFGGPGGFGGPPRFGPGGEGPGGPGAPGGREPRPGDGGPDPGNRGPVPPNGGPGPGGFGPGGFGSGGPGRFGGGGVAGRLDEVKKLIGSRDEEWKVIGPKLQKVVAARQALTDDGLGTAGTTRFGGGPPGPGSGPGGDAGSRGGSALTQARADLKATLSDPDHSVDDVREKLAAVAEAVESARRDLKAAQEGLSLLLTADQREIVAGLGYLD